MDKLNDFQTMRDKLISEEHRFWSKFKEQEKTTSTLQDESSQLLNKLSMLKKMYERLEKTTFINEVFEISSAGEFGTISGFRLGKN
jgi:predicted nuclease with TOPRIM domain